MEPDAAFGDADLADFVGQIRDSAVICLDPDGTILTWNTGAERLKGYPRAEAVGRSFTMFYTDGDRRSHLPQRLLTTAAVQGGVNHTGWRVRRDGTRFWGDVSITAVRGRGGRLRGFVKVTKDRSEQHATVTRSQELLAEAVHDVGTPLTAAVGFVELARETADPAGAEWLRRATVSLGRVTTLLGTLGASITLSPGGATFAPANVDLLQVARETVETLDPLMDTSRVVVGSVGVSAHVVRGDLERILTNLVSNALRYSSKGPVLVEASMIGDVAQLTVADRGRGIAPGDLATIFEPLERGRLAEDGDGGSGIGLASVRDLVAGQRGQVRIDSVVGTGTVVTVELPAAVGTPPVPAP